MGGNGLFVSERAYTLRRGRFDVYRVDFDLERASEIATHLVQIREQMGPLGDNRHIDVTNAPTAFGQPAAVKADQNFGTRQKRPCAKDAGELAGGLRVLTGEETQESRRGATRPRRAAAIGVREPPLLCCQILSTGLGPYA